MTTSIGVSGPTTKPASPPEPNDWLPHLSTVREYAPFVVLAAYLSLLFGIPSRLVFPPLGAAGRPAVMAGVALLILWCLVSIARRGLPRGSQPIRWVLLAYLATQVVGYATGYLRGLPELEANSADRFMIATFAVVGVALCFADGPRDRRQLDLVLRFLLLLGMFTALVGVAQFFVGFDLPQYLRIPGLRPISSLLEVSERGYGVARVSGMSQHYIEFGVVLAAMTPIAIHYALYAPSRGSAWIRWGAVALIAGAVPLSVSRSGILALGVGVITLAVVWSWRLRYNALVIGVVGLVLFRAISPGVLGTLRALFASAEHDPSVQGRTEDYEIVFPMIFDDFLFGRGAGTFMPERYVLLDNQFLYTLVSTGVVGLIGFIALFVGGISVARSVRRRAAVEEDRHLAQALCAALAACLVTSFTFDALSFVQFTGLLFVLLGTVGALWRLSRTRVAAPAVTAKEGQGLVMPPLWPDLKWVNR